MSNQNLEIEKKFLVDPTCWKKSSLREQATRHTIVQGYITTQSEATVRLRIKDTQAFLTIKGRPVGISRKEFEYAIPLSDAQEMLSAFAKRCIAKTRFVFSFKGYTWEVDEFEGEQAPLILAEVELESETETPACPNFIAQDVSQDIRYTNAFLSEKPYTTW